MPAASSQPAPGRSGSIGRSAVLVASGILASRLAGFVRATLVAKYLGQTSDPADAFAAAFKIPNFLQNLFGEGALSASFIPVYAGLRGAEDHHTAGHVARLVFAWLALVMAVFVLLGILLTPELIVAIAPGFAGAKREMTVTLVRILFPGVALLVLAAWGLAILNSHGRFFLSYAAPVVWNAAMIASLLVFRHDEPAVIAVALAWGALVGSGLQAAVQVPVAWRLLARQRDTAGAQPHVRNVLRNFVPVFVSRGVVQVSAYVDGMIASFLGTGAVAALTNAQLLYTLPISLFAMSVSAAELPAMSTAVGARRDITDTLRSRISRGQEAMAAFVIPSAIAFMALGDVIAALVFQRGRTTHADAVYVWAILSGSAIGLLSSAVGRLYSAGFYALGDTRTPLRFALIRVALVAGLGYLCAIPLPQALGINLRWGAAGLTASAGAAGWIEYALLRRSLQRRIGVVPPPSRGSLKVWISALTAALVATGARRISPAGQPFVEGVIVLSVYGGVFLGLAHALGVPETSQLINRVFPRRGQRPRDET
jgi:putative peptidoglycan lipid II flippase